MIYKNVWMQSVSKNKMPHYAILVYELKTVIVGFTKTVPIENFEIEKYMSKCYQDAQQ